MLKRFSQPGSLDELEELWRECASKCKHYLDKEEVARWKQKSPSMEKEEVKYCSKCHQMKKTSGENCPECGRLMYHIYGKKSPP